MADKFWGAQKFWVPEGFGRRDILRGRGVLVAEKFLQ